MRALACVPNVCTGELSLVECVDARLDMIGFGGASARLAPVSGQWWRMNRAGLSVAVRAAGFDVVSASRPFLTPFGAHVTGNARGWRRLVAALRAALVRWPGLGSNPALVRLAGLIRGTYDVVLRARPD